MTMRDAFFYQIFESAKQNPDIVVLTSDFSAPSFDRFRTELSGQFINTGISEQNTILVAAGLAQSGKIVFVTSIAPFIIMRCFEQTRLYVADMNLPVKIVGIGAGFSYNTAGPTHHALEDIALMRTLPNMEIFLPSDNKQVEWTADYLASSKTPAYVRLDRLGLSGIYEEKDHRTCMDTGFCCLREKGETAIISNGYMTHTALKAADELLLKGIYVRVIDIHRIPLVEEKLLDQLKDVSSVLTLEEHVLSGGMGSYLLEMFSEHGIALPLKRMALNVNQGFYHGYGTRDGMHEACGISIKQVVEYIVSTSNTK